MTYRFALQGIKILTLVFFLSLYLAGTCAPDPYWYWFAAVDKHDFIHGLSLWTPKLDMRRDVASYIVLWFARTVPFISILCWWRGWVEMEVMLDTRYQHKQAEKCKNHAMRAFILNMIIAVLNIISFLLLFMVVMPRLGDAKDLPFWGLKYSDYVKDTKKSSQLGWLFAMTKEGIVGPALWGQLSIPVITGLDMLITAWVYRKQEKWTRFGHTLDSLKQFGIVRR